MDKITDVIFENIPKSFEEFIELSQDMITRPEDTAALFILALLLYTRDEAFGVKALSYLKGRDIMDEQELFLQVKKPLEKSPYLPLSFFMNSLPENGYTPSEPYTIRIKTDDAKLKDKHFKTLYIGCNGSGSYRPITLQTIKPAKIKKLQNIFLREKKYEIPIWLVCQYPSVILNIKAPDDKNN